LLAENTLLKTALVNPDAVFQVAVTVGLVPVGHGGDAPQSANTSGPAGSVRLESMWMRILVRSLVKPVAATETRTPAQTSLMAPTAGTLTKAGMVSLEVSIFKPPPAVAENAACAVRVRPVHVTITAPAGRMALSARVIVMVLAEYDEVTAVAGEEMAHLFAGAALTTPFGNVSMTLLIF